MTRAEYQKVLEEQIEWLAGESYIRATVNNEQDGIVGMSLTMAKTAKTITDIRCPLSETARKNLDEQIRLLAKMNEENHSSAGDLMKRAEAINELIHACFYC